MTATAAVPDTAARRRHVPWWASRPAWVVLGLVALAALAVGSVHGNPDSESARIAHLDSIVKCPACEDLSIAQSDAPSAVALRRRVATFVDRGWSDARVESWVTARYGESALLVPDSTGVSATLYIVPLVLVGSGVVGLGWYLWRRRTSAPFSRDSGAAHG